MMSLSDLCTVLMRKKKTDPNEVSNLARVLNLFDLTALGVGTTLGIGVYVMAASVAYYQAGPAVVLSFLIAAVPSMFAGETYLLRVGTLVREKGEYIRVQEFLRKKNV